MAIQIVNTTLTGVGPVVNLGTADSLVVGRNGLISTTNFATAVNGTGSGHYVRVEGGVYSTNAVQLGDTADLDSSQNVFISETGVLQGTSSGLAVFGAGSIVTNYGTISGAGGLFLASTGAAETRVFNAGEIHGSNAAVYTNGLGTGDLRIVNVGTIAVSADVSAYGAIQTSGGNDTVLNSGTLIGRVWLAAGNDTYDGRGGTVSGTVYGEEGEDNFKPGAAGETFDGGAGSDTIDFRGGSAVTVALDGSRVNTGAAKNDTYISVENIQGSGFGGDWLIGSVGANRLRGWAGADTLNGGAGNDQVIGGSGIDRLTGGGGGDRFVFEQLAHCGDTITDFTNATGNNDAFNIDASAFGGGLVAGALAASQFRARADNLAQDSNDRFIFRTTDKTLWFDVNGSAAGGLTLVADLQASATVSAADIFLI